MRIYVVENIKMLLFLLINLFKFDYMHLTLLLIEHSHAPSPTIYVYERMRNTNYCIYLLKCFILMVSFISDRI